MARVAERGRVGRVASTAREDSRGGSPSSGTRSPVARTTGSLSPKRRSPGPVRRNYESDATAGRGQPESCQKVYAHRRFRHWAPAALDSLTRQRGAGRGAKPCGSGCQNATGGVRRRTLACAGVGGEVCATDQAGARRAYGATRPASRRDTWGKVAGVARSMTSLHTRSARWTRPAESLRHRPTSPFPGHEPRSSCGG